MIETIVKYISLFIAYFTLFFGVMLVISGIWSDVVVHEGFSILNTLYYLGFFAFTYYLYRMIKDEL